MTGGKRYKTHFEIFDGVRLRPACEDYRDTDSWHKTPKPKLVDCKRCCGTDAFLRAKSGLPSPHANQATRGNKP